MGNTLFNNNQTKILLLNTIGLAILLSIIIILLFNYEYYISCIIISMISISTMFGFFIVFMVVFMINAYLNLTKKRIIFSIV
jgi:glucan phosphoethanolaminetransferase (alkaline phosphatase superfamily)